MDRRTARAYHRAAAEWIARRGPDAIADGRLPAFLRRVRAHGWVADLGCGPGWYGALMSQSRRVVALDLSAAMLEECGRRAPEARRIRADLEALPLAAGSLDGAWAANCYSHIPRTKLPLALADLHAVLRVDAPVEVTMARLDRCRPTTRDLERGETERRFSGDLLRGRLFTAVSVERARSLFIGAGFATVRVRPLASDDFWLVVSARRGRTLPDLVRSNLRLIVCGLNPSLYSADAGVPFARPGNRFWPAALAAGLVDRPHDPRTALRRGIGFTDLVKRATTGASELAPREYANGLARVATLVRLYRPAAVCFVGLDGWRASVDRRAQPGWIRGGFAGTAAYLMPSTSGRNARVSVTALADHLRAASGLVTRREWEVKANGKQETNNRKQETKNG